MTGEHGFDIEFPFRTGSYMLHLAAKELVCLQQDADDWDMLGRASMRESGLIPSVWMTDCDDSHKSLAGTSCYHPRTAPSPSSARQTLRLNIAQSLETLNASLSTIVIAIAVGPPW
jgi:hypothetical protein